MVFKNYNKKKKKKRKYDGCGVHFALTPQLQFKHLQMFCAVYSLFKSCCLKLDLVINHLNVEYGTTAKLQQHRSAQIIHELIVTLEELQRFTALEGESVKK